ncbi:hypothetical protein [Pseudidiomarina terrestris]|uniref:hypothetical protein n=1 Tax=Pseudidiomarina terrestris TaxID=2820060 RepID=UPI0026520734|nr:MULTISPECIES: hypothetical protein [unclassified Pseudidiomarina]MDN7135642.1 hypothetical protein [Pseudidiomarina sp. 1ASP75-5]MDN7137320.1 hypothetical protein [Pseudidiomarina sp. 1ASP75-14]MEA3588613.1 hypothetical protein [Pseudidiomarina sp. 1APP75-27a]
METNHMETNHIAPPKRRSVALLKTLIVAAGLTCSGAALAVDKIYSCDTCDAQKAEWVAAQHVPEPNCYSTNTGTSAPTPDDVVCDPVFSTFIVANPISEEAYKFRVSYPCTGSFCNRSAPVITTLTINDHELSDLQLFYQTDQDFREMMRAAPTVTDISSDDISVALSADEQKSSSDPNSGGEDCSVSPVRYFTSTSYRAELEDIMADVLANAAGSQSFQSVTRDTDLTGFSVGRGGISLSVEHNQNNLHHIVSFNGDPTEDRLAFRVNYVGDATAPELERIYLEFHLVYPSSRIEGVNLEQLLQGPVSLLDEDDIGCLSTLFDDPEISETLSQGSPQWFPADTGEGAGPDLGYFRCATTTETETCSTLEDGSRQCIVSTVTHWDVCESQP